jgi:hypothetical protein
MSAEGRILPSSAEAIRALMPWATDEQIKARAKLMVMQQRSATRPVASCSTMARELWWLINEQAARNGSRPLR